MEDLVSVLLQKDPNDRPSAKQLLYVPTMQPYVKRFLQCERDRIDSVASDISNISSRSTHDCSQISNPGKTEKEHKEVHEVKSFNTSRQDGEVKQNSNTSAEIARCSSSRERRLSSNKAPQEQDKRRASERAPRQQEHSRVADKGPKAREPFHKSDSVPKEQEHLREKCPADKRKQSLLALAHAQQRRHSEQTSARSQPGTRILKGRIHSHGAQVRDISESEDDVFVANYPTVIPSRKPDMKYVNKTREIKKSVSNASVPQCSSRFSSVAEEKKQKPTMYVHQPKNSEDMRTRTRRQSAVAVGDESSWSNEQKHRRLTSRSEFNRVDKENVSVN